MINVIEKKILPEYYTAVANGRKTFEVRKEDDCRYNVGDLLILNLYSDGHYVEGESIICKITYVLRDIDGIESGYAVVGIEQLQPY